MTSLQSSWGDAVYVRDFPAFERPEPLALLKLAAILHENYRSYDLAARALAVHDGRCERICIPLRPACWRRINGPAPVEELRS